VTRVSVAAVILAAGGGSRFTGSTHKLLAPLRGRPVIAWVLDAVQDAGFERIYVVTGAVDLSSVLPPTVIEVPSPEWARGQAHTLQAAVARAVADGLRAIVVGLGDQPMVPAAAWRSVAASVGEIAIASFDGALRPPVKLEHTVWPLLPTDGDQGARDLVRTRPDLVSEIPCRGNPTDIDTEEDLAQWS
jgi:molybdenum cofactor cytidylyltransferase